MENKALSTEELQKQEMERQKLEKEENQKKIAEILPKFQSEFDALCKKYGVMVEPFIIPKDIGIIPALRIRLANNQNSNPYDAK